MVFWASKERFFVVLLFRAPQRPVFYGLKILSCSKDISKVEISLQNFESKHFLRENRAKSLFYTVFINKFHRIINLIALLYFKENRLLKIWSRKDKFIQIPIQNGKMEVVFNKFHHSTNGTFV
jgi:hypothetical protein